MKLFYKFTYAMAMHYSQKGLQALKRSKYKRASKYYRVANWFIARNVKFVENLIEKHIEHIPFFQEDFNE